MSKKTTNKLDKHYTFEMCEIYDRKVLYTKNRVISSHIPDGMYHYGVQTEDNLPDRLYDDVESGLFDGTVLSVEPITGNTGDSDINESVEYPLEIGYNTLYCGPITAEEYLGLFK